MKNKNVVIENINDMLSPLYSEAVCYLNYHERTIPLVPIHDIAEGDTQHYLQHIAISDKYLGQNFLFKEVFKEINKEKLLLINEISLFFNMEPMDRELQNRSVAELFDLIRKYVVRIKRLLLVYNPNFNKSKSRNSIGGDEYDMVKINWINDKNRVFRKVTRTYGKVGKDGVKLTIKKLLEKLSTNIIYYDTKKIKGVNSKYGFDFFVLLDEDYYGLYYDTVNKDNLIELSVILENWEAYKKCYLK